MSYNPFFEVIKQPAITVLEDGTQIDTGRFALINAETHDVLGIVSKNYKVAENREIAEVCDQAFADLNVREISDHMNGPTNRWVRRIILDDDQYTFRVGGDDTLKMAVDVYNGYNGQISAGFNLSAYRLVCSNGLMGWRKFFGMSFNHLVEDLAEKIRQSLDVNVRGFAENVTIWESWDEVPFDQEDFNRFVDSRVKSEDNPFRNEMNTPLSKKQGEEIKSLYPEIKNKYNERDTKWGAYNVLTAIATHYTRARKGSYLFSNAYSRMMKLAQEFYNFEQLALSA